MRIFGNENLKVVKSEDYNHIFNKKTGFSVRWGKEKKDDPDLAPAPELLDIEISTVLPTKDVEQYKNNSNLNIVQKGCNGIGCHFCYKGNKRGRSTVNMSLGMFQEILSKIPKSVCQIAFGITSIDANPDLWDIMRYTRKCGIIPNITINGVNITNEDLEKLKEICGAVAVSVNEKNISHSINCLKRMIDDYQIEQTNIHYVIYKNSYDFLFKLIDFISDDKILKNLNALVLLSAKDKQNCGLQSITLDQYKEIIQYAQDKQVRLGFDSCSANLYMKCIQDDENFEKMNQYVEPCESGLFSFYINAFGKGYVCSFAEEISHEWDLLKVVDFQKEVWYSEEMKMWRQKLLDGNRNCPFYDIRGE